MEGCDTYQKLSEYSKREFDKVFENIIFELPPLTREMINFINGFANNFDEVENILQKLSFPEAMIHCTMECVMLMREMAKNQTALERYDGHADYLNNKRLTTDNCLMLRLCMRDNITVKIDD
jgi:hypothetical protein